MWNLQKWVALPPNKQQLGLLKIEKRRGANADPEAGDRGLNKVYEVSETSLVF
jgi:hypothetical protein